MKHLFCVAHVDQYPNAENPLESDGCEDAEITSFQMKSYNNIVQPLAPTKFVSLPGRMQDSAINISSIEK